MANLAFAIILLLALLRLARPALCLPDGQRNVVFGRRGFAGLCVYFVLTVLPLLRGIGVWSGRPQNAHAARMD